MSDLVAWLTQILDEDEARYRTDAGPEEHREQALNSPDLNESYIVSEAIRKLEDISAKRVIVAHAERWFRTLHETPEGWTEKTCTAYRMAMEWTLRQLASAYADRPGYDEI
jgi:hypothetical protein